MFGKGSDIYRQKALERLSSPDAVDQLLHVVGPRDWLPLIATGLLISVLLTWSFWGTIPTAVTARGVLVHPRTIVDSQTLISGRLESLNIKPGDSINAGDLIGRIDQSELASRLQEDRSTLAQLQQQDRTKISLEDQQVSLQKQQIDAERNYIGLQAETIRKTLQDAQALAPLLKKRLDGLRELQTQGLIAEVSPDLLQAERDVLENETKITDQQARMQQLDGSLRELETRAASLVRLNMESSMLRQNEIRDLQGRVSLGERQLSRNGEIRSEFSGRVVEVTATVGQFVDEGTRLARIEINEPDRTLVSISYLPVGEGKRVRPGMAVQVTPDTVERQRFGGIIGIVESVSELPVTRESALLIVGNPELVDSLLPSGPFIEITARPETDGSTYSGYRWSSSAGPDIRLSAGLTTTSRVTVEGRAPITYVFPFLRSLSGIY